MKWGPGDDIQPAGVAGETFTLRVRPVRATANVIVVSLEETPDGLRLNVEPSTPQDADILYEWTSPAS